MLFNRSVMSHRRLCRVMLGGSLMVYGVLVQAADNAATAKVPPLEIEPMATGNLVQMVLGLIAVLMLIVGLSWIVRRMGGVTGSASGSLRVLGGLSLGTRERVILVQVGDTQLLLGVAPGRVQTLHVLEHPIDPQDHGKSTKGNFAASLSAALQRGKQS